tara:strand:+ start:89 stop:568 length:480 start_codon:yes stop_codon:yes gene_type:complete
MKNKYVLLNIILLSWLFSFENKLKDNDPLTVWAGFKTWHWDNSDNTNNDNQIIGIMWRDKFIAYFKNSGHQRSWIIGTGWDKRIIPLKNLYIDARFGVGIAGGYEYMSNLGGDLHLVPGFVPSFGIGYNIKNKFLLGLDMIYIPTEHGGVFIYGTSISF